MPCFKPITPNLSINRDEVFVMEADKVARATYIKKSDKYGKYQ